MYMMLSYDYQKPNGICSSEISYLSNTEVEEELKEAKHYIQDKGVYYWNDPSRAYILIPVDKNKVATYSRRE